MYNLVIANLISLLLIRLIRQISKIGKLHFPETLCVRGMPVSRYQPLHGQVHTIHSWHLAPHHLYQGLFSCPNIKFVK